MGIKQRQAYNYIQVVESLPARLIEENAAAGVTKLALLAKLNPEEREDLTGEALANITVVCGAGEGLDRTIVEVDRTSGEDRRELLVDARDLSQGEQTEDEYKAILTQRGHDKLDEHNRIQSFEAGIKSSSQFRYTEDWNLGDIVTGRQTEWGVSMDQRVTEVEEIYENDTMTVVPTLGTPAPETYNLEDNIA